MVRLASFAQAAAWPGVGKVVLSVPSSATMTWAASMPIPVSSSSRSITDSTGAPGRGQDGAWPPPISPLFFFTDTATTEIYTLSLHDALPICGEPLGRGHSAKWHCPNPDHPDQHPSMGLYRSSRSEEHTSELQSRRDLVC